MALPREKTTFSLLFFKLHIVKNKQRWTDGTKGLEEEEE
jgi:hypothetical protein